MSISKITNGELNLPAGFQFPTSYEAALASVSKDDIYPWWFIALESGKTKLFFDIINVEMKSSKMLIPFAKIDDESGDVACFDGEDNSGNPKVYFSAGTEQTHKGVDWESRYHLKDFDAWLENARKGQ